MKLSSGREERQRAAAYLGRRRHHVRRDLSSSFQCAGASSRHALDDSRDQHGSRTRKSYLSAEIDFGERTGYVLQRFRNGGK